ncbi:THAP domain-containing protein 5-like isoform X2 [Mugil cephalus]|nr:THAP domain-containing protein 5-like isoform X2 [Mugil cephalus]
MKREEWTPSRHQYLCSEHFTEDCFDIRWGIRYLKNTAIPTVFPSAYDGEKKVASIKRSPKSKASTSDNEFKGSDSPLSKRPLILSRACRKLQSGTANDNVAEHTAIVFELPLLSDTGTSCHSDISEKQTVACDKTADSGMPTASRLGLSPYDEPDSEERADSTVTVLCCEPFPHVDSNADVAALRAVLGQAVSFVPVEMVKDEPAGCFLEEGDGEHISLYEHSYCRPDTDKDQLWSKILSLHAKILELDRREESTVAKIRALESEIAHLKRDSQVFKEKQKVLEDYISSVLL